MPEISLPCLFNSFLVCKVRRLEASHAIKEKFKTCAKSLGFSESSIKYPSKIGKSGVDNLGFITVGAEGNFKDVL